jgi:excinuclease ABC subunit A
MAQSDPNFFHPVYAKSGYASGLTMMDSNSIRIRGARQHNLKNIDLQIPKNQLVVFTGPSGSGKSSLAFDTLFAEGQRRYVQSLSSYARQFLDQMEKPDVDSIEGLSPAVAIEQRSSVGNPRSTVATVTEIYDYLRVLYATCGQVHHPETGALLQKVSSQDIVDEVLREPAGRKFQVLAPLVRGEKGAWQDVIDRLKREGFVRVRIDGEKYASSKKESASTPRSNIPSKWSWTGWGFRPRHAPGSARRSNSPSILATDC